MNTVGRVTLWFLMYILLFMLSQIMPEDVDEMIVLIRSGFVAIGLAFIMFGGDK